MEDIDNINHLADIIRLPGVDEVQLDNPLTFKVVDIFPRYSQENRQYFILQFEQEVFYVIDRNGRQYSNVAHFYATGTAATAIEQYPEAVKKIAQTDGLILTLWGYRIGKRGGVSVNCKLQPIQGIKPCKV